MYLVESLARSAQVAPHTLACVCADRRLGYGELHERVSRVAGGLRELGVGPGTRVAMLAANSDRYLEYYHAVGWAGGVIVPLNNRWSQAERAYALRDAGVAVLLAGRDFLDEAIALRAQAASLRRLVSIDAADRAYPGVDLDYAALAAAPALHEPQRRSAEDLFGIFYTGGTTGEAKGVMLSSRGLWANVQLLLREYDYRQGEKLAIALPMFHLAAGANVLAMIAAAGTLVILPGFDAAAVLATIERERVAHICLVPTMIRMLLDHADFARTDLSSLRRISYGAAPIPEALLRRLLALLPRVELVQAFGQTEMSPVVSVLRPEQHRLEAAGKLGSVGQAVYGTRLRIVDAAGKELPRGAIGEIAASGPGTMLGYWNKPAQTAATLVEGWVRTGDAGYLDEDGFLFLVDRIKDMIVSGGENIYSVEVENALASHPAIVACAVIGVPDQTWGERVHAVVVPGAGPPPSVEELQDHCRARIAGYKCPRSVEFVTALPLSAAGKVLKTELRKPHWSGHSRQIA